MVSLQFPARVGRSTDGARQALGRAPREPEHGPERAKSAGADIPAQDLDAGTDRGADGDPERRPPMWIRELGPADAGGEVWIDQGPFEGEPDDPHDEQQ